MAETATRELEPSSVETKAPVLSSDQGFWTIAWRQFRKDTVSVLGLVVVALLAAIAIFSPFVANGRPYRISGILTNFYSNEIAGWNDWHKLYRQRADELADSGKLSETDRVQKAGEADKYRRGLPRILERLAGYMKAEDAAALRALTAKYEKLLEAPPEKLDRVEYEELGKEIDEKFGTLALEPAYKRLAGPLVDFEFGSGDPGVVPLLKRAQALQSDARDAREDGDKKALAAVSKKLEGLAPELEPIAARVEGGARAMAAFLEPLDAQSLEQTARDLAGTLRSFRDPKATDDLAVRYADLSSRIDAFARKAVPPERARLPRTTKYPIVDYLTPREVGFVVLYVTLVVAFLARTAFGRATARIPLDPSDLAFARLGVLLAPALLAALVWWLAVPEREPPSDTYYKKFVEEITEKPDGRSSITFAPVPYGENENVQEDKQSAPTWCEDRAHLVTRLRGRDLPPGVSEEQLTAWLEPPVKDGKPTARETLLHAAEIETWVKALVEKRLTPYRYHWLGTDTTGRDALARLVVGSRISLSVGFVAVGINVLIGIVLGSLAGYFRGWVDIAISRFTEIIMCFPSFFLILAVNVILPPSIWNVMLAIGLIGWTGEMRLIRGEFLRLVNLDFVTAGRALGLSNARVIFRHMLPNAMAPVLVAATFGIAGAILTESGLSFLGFGVPPPGASWGSVLNEAFGKEQQMWWITIFPGFMIFLTITAYNLVGEGFRDATDPRLRK